MRVRQCWSRMRTSGISAAAVAAAAIVLAIPGAAAAQPPYSFSKILVPGSVYTDASGINNAGQIVGTYQDSAGGYHGYIFDGTTYTTVEYPNGTHHYLFGIGPSGQLLGSTRRRIIWGRGTGSCSQGRHSRPTTIRARIPTSAA